MKLNVFLLAAIIALVYVYELVNISRGPLHDFKFSVDNYIPTISFFIVIYLSYFLFLISSLIVFLVKYKPFLLRVALVSILISFAISYSIYLLYQSYIERPILNPGDLLTDLTLWVYKIDNPYNGFPSLHVALSTISAVSWVKAKDKLYPLMVVWAILIAFSTLVIKQHYLADVLAGIALGFFSYYLANKIVVDKTVKAW